MKKCNLMMVFDPTMEHVLMSAVEKEPFSELYHLVGGINNSKGKNLSMVYQMLKEETGISNSQITLNHFASMSYPFQNLEFDVYMGRLKNKMPELEETDIFAWVPIGENFIAPMGLTGYDNISVMVEQAKCYQKSLFSRS